MRSFSWRITSERATQAAVTIYTGQCFYLVEELHILHPSFLDAFTLTMTLCTIQLTLGKALLCTRNPFP